jgi:hypothetical protein
MTEGNPRGMTGRNLKVTVGNPGGAASKASPDFVPTGFLLVKRNDIKDGCSTLYA